MQQMFWEEQMPGKNDAENLLCREAEGVGLDLERLPIGTKRCNLMQLAEKCLDAQRCPGTGKHDPEAARTALQLQLSQLL